MVVDDRRPKKSDEIDELMCLEKSAGSLAFERSDR